MKLWIGCFCPNLPLFFLNRKEKRKDIFSVVIRSCSISIVGTDCMKAMWENSSALMGAWSIICLRGRLSPSHVKHAIVNHYFLYGGNVLELRDITIDHVPNATLPNMKMLKKSFCRMLGFNDLTPHHHLILCAPPVLKDPAHGPPREWCFTSQCLELEVLLRRNFSVRFLPNGEAVLCMSNLLRGSFRDSIHW